ncbi:MAG: gliding motility-associated C-terminal domain-containing protein [Bacteroidetes bacterium]|nr:gliding motility-associated C-terminal domain-containing protein [Bacteroidota bacterium]
MKNGLSFIFLLCFSQLMGQGQTCPVNIDNSDGTLTHWFAYTGLFSKNTSRTHADQIRYDSSAPAPTGTLGATSITEYSLQNRGIEVITNNTLDPFGFFETIPFINGYAYSYSVKVGSSSLNTDQTRNTTNGGLFRGIGYTIHVPNGLVTDPYVVTYAYAMVLESAPHENDQVPMFTATLTTNSGTIDCANANYLLPTQPSGSTYILDQQAALQEGFSQSSTPSPNDNGNRNENPYRVWTKAWREVIFDLAKYRGQDVTLTFQSDNCVPSGHFAYAYVALKNVCQGLEIAGTTKACTNGTLTYAIPELTGASYTWTIPNGWQTVKDSANTITVIPDANPGTIVARAVNSCADLKANINVVILPPTVAGTVKGDSVVCYGLIPNQSFPLSLSGNRGSVLNWISSTDRGLNWTNIYDTSKNITVKNLSKSTLFRAVVQNGGSCRVDSSNAVIITLNNKPTAGTISPDNVQVCLGQTMANGLTLNGSRGTVFNWQKSTDQINWNNVSPSNTDTIQSISNINGKTYFRAIVANTGCPSDTSNKVTIGIYNVQFPKASIYPKDTIICFGTAAFINANIQTGTTYSWSNPSALYNGGSGIISGTPFIINAKAAPTKKTDYIIRISNAGCPNFLYDTIHVDVRASLTINAGRDTTVLINQPLQLSTIVSDERRIDYQWTPSTGLNSANAANPIAILDGNQDHIKYTVSIIDSIGCSASDNILVTINRNGPDIFVPTGFTPNADGKNDLLRPTAVGITNQFYFSVYNRWGQQVYFTNEVGKGWDGTWNGAAQPSGAYVFVTEGKDYLGNKITRKGTAVLIR